MLTPVAQKDSTRVEEQMLSIVRELLRELGARDAADKVSLHSSLERDLGLGSLERVELLIRAERRFGRHLPDSVAQTADTPAAWVRALLEPQQASSNGFRLRGLRPEKDAPAAPAEASSFTEVLRHHAERVPERVQIHLLEEEGQQDISYGRLLERSSEVAAGLIAGGLRRDDAVAIMLPTCEDFFYSVLGVMLAGGIAVPIYPPARPDKIEEYVRRQTLILQNAEVRFLISFEQVRAVSRVMRPSLPTLIDVTTAAALRERGAGGPARAAPNADTFFIQYTSGSTGNPKGVVLSHANVLANVRGIGWAVQAKPDDVVVSWLPLYHDMGLIGSWLFSVYQAFPITIMSPLAFLSRPERWLWALSDSGGTLCPAPNFSYELCARKVSDEDIEGVDLSAWRVAINAGEPVLPETLERFARRFEPYGFRRESYVPCYGLAESSVALTFPSIDRAPVIDTIGRGRFETEGRAVPAQGSGADVLRFVANGGPLPGHEVRLVDDAGRDVPERVQGRLLLRGPSKTAGYYRNPEATKAVTTADGWMDSGDLGYRADGEIYVTGRHKDCIIKAGHNIIPQEVEMAAAEVRGVRRGCVAAFGTVDRDSGTERLVVVAETRATDPAELERIRAEVIQRVDAGVGLPPDRVELVAPQTVPKTSSGKIRRHESRLLYERGELRAEKRHPWVQMLGLWAGSFGGWFELLARRVLAGLRAAYKTALITTVGVVAGLLIRLWPSRKGMSSVVRLAARLLLEALGGRLRSDASTIATRQPALLLANRVTGTDLLAALASLRSAVLLAEERGLALLPWQVSFLLEPIVAPAAEGVGPHQRAGDLRARVEQALRAGYAVMSVAHNPPGTLAERSRFRLEPIEAAAAMPVPVYPVCIQTADGSLDGRTKADSPVGSRVQVGAALHIRNGNFRDLAGFREQVRRALGDLAS